MKVPLPRGGEAYLERSSRQLKGVLAFDGLPDQPTGALDESDLVREAAFQQDTDAKVASHIRHCDQRHVLGDAQVHQLVGFDQDEERLGRWSLDFGELAFEVLDENIMQTTAECDWLLADELEASV